MSRYLCLIASLFLTILFSGETLTASPLSGGFTSAGSDAQNTILSNEFFSAFQVKELNGEVLVSWEVTEKHNVSHYLIERKANAGAYLAIGGINVSRQANPDAHLDFFDKMRQKHVGQFIYRVKQVMMSGAIHYSPEISILRLSPTSIHVYPQFDGETIKLEFDQKVPAPYVVQLMDLNGRLLYTEQIAVDQFPLGRCVLSVADLPKGMYIIRIEDPANSWAQRILLP